MDGIRSILRNKQTKSISITPQQAIKLKNSLLEFTSLNRREAAISKRERSLDRLVNDKVKKLLPQEIKRYEEEIPRFRSNQKAIKAKEAELAKKEAEIAAKAQELQQKEHELNLAKQSLMILIEEGVREKLAKRILKKIEESYNKAFTVINNFFVGTNQQAYFDSIGSLEVAKEITANGHKYKSTTIADGFKEAERLDIKQAIIDSGCAASDIDSSDINKVRKALTKGETIEDAAMRIASNILRDLGDDGGR